MQRIIQHCGNEVQQEMLRFPKLHEKIIDVVTNLLRSRLPPTSTMVENIVAIELAYINTKHPDFQKDALLVGSLMGNFANNVDDRMRRTSTAIEQKPAKNRPNSVHFPNPQAPNLPNGDSDKENSLPKVAF